MNQAEQTALISILVMCGAVAAAHIIAALYLLRRAEKKAESPQEPKGKDPAQLGKANIDPISPKTAKERKKRQRPYL